MWVLLVSLFFVLVMHSLLYLLFIKLIYDRHLKKDKSIIDYRKPVLRSVFTIDCIGFLFVAFIGKDRVLMYNTFESYFFPIVGFFASVALSFYFIFFVVFKAQKKYIGDTVKVLLCCSPYLLFLPLINNLFVTLGFYSAIH